MDTATVPRDNRIDILGVGISLVDPLAVHDWLHSALTSPWDGQCRHVVTINPEYVMAARRDPVFAHALARADLATIDGIGVLIAARLLAGRRARKLGRMTGYDLVETLVAQSGTFDAPIFLLGGRPGVAAAAAARITREHPSARIAGHCGGSGPNQADDRSSVLHVAASRARVVLVAYGAPAQVLWIDRNRTQLAERGVRLAIGIGGVMDYLAGTVPRSPAVVRRFGLEWLYRLAYQPWRWRRQTALLRFALLVGLRWLWRRGNRARHRVKVMIPTKPQSPSRPVQTPSPTPAVIPPCEPTATSLTPESNERRAVREGC